MFDTCCLEKTGLYTCSPLMASADTCGGNTLHLQFRTGQSIARPARWQVARVLEATDLESSEKLYRTRVQVRNGNQLEERQVCTRQRISSFQIYAASLTSLCVPSRPSTT